MNIEIVLLLLSMKSLHWNLSSDLEITRWKKFLFDFLKKSPKNHEWLFGMSQINFLIGMNEIAIEYISKAIECSRGTINRYCVWKAIYLYFIFLNNKQDSRIKTKKLANDYLLCEWAALAAEKQSPDNITINYLILILSIEKISLMKNNKSVSSSIIKSPTIYASKIMKLNKYFGYIAWVEVYLKDKTKLKLANEVLFDLMTEYPNSPHAFLRKWRKEYESDAYLDWILPIEELFLKDEEMNWIPELKIIIALLYSKSLAKTNQFILACELVQNEFYKKPTHTAFLYYYGKYAWLSPHPNFQWVSIGVLKECLKSCISQRSVKVNYYLGLAFHKTTQILKGMKYFEKSKECQKKNPGIIQCFCLSQNNLNEIEK